MPCPFLGRLPGNFLKNYGPLMKMFADQCPVVSRGVSINKSTCGPVVSNPDVVDACPFLKDVHSNDNKFYDYEGFFKDQILKKKLDHSYRVFKKVNRNAQNFPTGKEYTWGEKEINVWCSNDYLGMSAHPKVTGAVK